MVSMGQLHIGVIPRRLQLALRPQAPSQGSLQDDKEQRGLVDGQSLLEVHSGLHEISARP